MTREIKFRAWDGRQMQDVDGMNLYLTNEGLFELWSGSFAMADTFEKEKRDYPIMQYTGLKDKNGKEIYEGDIVFEEDGEYSKTVIITCKDEYIEFFGKDVYTDDSFTLEEIDGEIIGNIYENPDLLT